MPKACVYSLNGVPVVALSKWEAYLVGDWATELRPHHERCGYGEASAMEIVERALWANGSLAVQVVATWALWDAPEGITKADLQRILRMVNRCGRATAKLYGHANGR